jgi:disulfide bond formation protein DsbB
VSCKDVTFKIFGLSLATFNIFISLILSAITMKLSLGYEKNK